MHFVNSPPYGEAPFFQEHKGAPRLLFEDTVLETNTDPTNPKK